MLPHHFASAQATDTKKRQTIVTTEKCSITVCIHNNFFPVLELQTQKVGWKNKEHIKAQHHADRRSA